MKSVSSSVAITTPFVLFMSQAFGFIFITPPQHTTKRTTGTTTTREGRLLSSSSFQLRAHEGAYSLPFPSSGGGGGGGDDDRQKHHELFDFNIIGSTASSGGSSSTPKTKQPSLSQSTVVEDETKDERELNLSTSILSSSDYFALEAFQLGTINASTKRSERLNEESKTKERFMFGNDLIQLRTTIANLQSLHTKNQRKRNKTTLDEEELDNLRMKIRRLQLRDAEYVYGEMLDMSSNAKQMGNAHDSQIYMNEATRVRGCLPHFNLDGLWVGKYGDHGYEMINVTYTGDTLVARKVTGDKNVPKDEITFMADLRPTTEKLGPIQLSETASKQWGTKALERYPGKGQVAAEGYKNAKYMDGQLIVVGEEYFSFAWIPIGYQIFFGRPSAELTLKMLKQSEAQILKKGRQALQTNDIHSMRQYAMKCLQVTDELYHWRNENDDDTTSGTTESTENNDGDDDLHFQ